MANIAEAYDALDAMGLAVKNKLRPQRDAGGANSCRIKGEPTYGKDFADWIKLRRWTRRVQRYGQQAFPRPESTANVKLSNAPKRFELPRMPGDDGIPHKDVVRNWRLAKQDALLEALGERLNAEDQQSPPKEASDVDTDSDFRESRRARRPRQARARLKAPASEEISEEDLSGNDTDGEQLPPRAGSASQTTTRPARPASEFFRTRMASTLRLRFETLKLAGVVRKKDSWLRQRQRYTAAVEAGCTGRIFSKILGPKKERIPADALWVPDGHDDEGNPIFRLLTGGAEVLAGVSAMGFETTAATGNRDSDGLSLQDFAEGKLPQRFLANDLDKLRNLARPQQWDPEIPDGDIMPEFTLQRLRVLLHRVKRNSAAGPSGLSYLLLFHAPEVFQQAFADIQRAYQILGEAPERTRHSYIYPITKSGPRGATLDGARQICLIEVFLKLASLNMSLPTSAIWHERGALDKIQTGFSPLSAPASTGAAVVAVAADARKKGKPLFLLVADIAKAFQAIPIWGMYLAARIHGMSHEAALFWLQTELCSKTGKLATCQFITDFGLSDTFKNETGARMGAPPSPIKFNSWLDILFRWLEAEGVKGVKLVRQNQDGTFTTVELHTLAFADDLLLLTESIEDMQRLLLLVDRFLQLFGVSLQPDKSTIIKVGSGPSATWSEDERVFLTRPDSAGVDTRVEIRRAAPDEATRYLGI